VPLKASTPILRRDKSTNPSWVPAYICSTNQPTVRIRVVTTTSPASGFPYSKSTLYGSLGLSLSSSAEELSLDKLSRISNDALGIGLGNVPTPLSMVPCFSRLIFTRFPLTKGLTTPPWAHLDLSMRSYCLTPFSGFPPDFRRVGQ
jgi:hypothetical protein